MKVAELVFQVYRVHPGRKGNGAFLQGKVLAEVPQTVAFFASAWVNGAAVPAPGATVRFSDVFFENTVYENGGRKFYGPRIFSVGSSRWLLVSGDMLALNGGESDESDVEGAA